MEHILVVEDEEILRNLMVHELRNAGYEVQEAADGEAAWNLLEVTQPDIILLDLLMPILNGYDLLMRIRQDERTKHLPALVLSNSGQINDLNRAYDCGADGVLIKTNFNPEQLVGKVKEVLEEKRRKTGDERVLPL